MDQSAAELHASVGYDWSELAIGTNSMGTALAERGPVQIVGAEHYTGGFRAGACSAVPVRHPRTGAMLGAISLSGPPQTAGPHALALVLAASRLVENALASTYPGAEGPDSQLRLLSGPRAVLQTARGPVVLSLRRSEILALLAYRRDGWTAEQLAIELLGDYGKPVNMRVELSRLRQQVGDAIETGPYRLAPRMSVDLETFEALLAAGSLHAALDLYNGPLLPGSDVPLINELRSRLDGQLRTRIIESRDPSIVERWLRTISGHDDAAAIMHMLALSSDEVTVARYRPRLERLERLGLV
jgi:hypothetical protein